jgi:arylsulfatase A-like enzyme
MTGLDSSARSTRGVVSALARIWIATLLVPACAMPATAPSVIAPKPPNIIVILADDLGYADISAYKVGRFKTPNIDRIGLEGVRFTDGYVTAPVCGPSRAGLQTGRYQERYGFEFNNGPARRDIEQALGLAVGEITIADALAGNGYYAGMIGKWHLGQQLQFYPMKRGYQEFVGFLPGATLNMDPSLPVVHNEHEYLTDYFSDRAVQFIRERSADVKPWFLYMSCNAVHSPMMVTDKYYARHRKIKDELLRTSMPAWSTATWSHRSIFSRRPSMPSAGSCRVTE